MMRAAWLLPALLGCTSALHMTVKSKEQHTSHHAHIQAPRASVGGPHKNQMARKLVVHEEHAATYVREQQVEHMTAPHKQQMDWAAQAISTDCTVTVDTTNRTLYIVSDIGKFTVKDKVITDEAGKVMDSPPKALICLGNADAPSTGPALMFAASGAKYLMTKTDQGNPFDFFLNKHCWSKNNNMQYYLWLGDIKGDHAGFMAKKDSDALPCEDGEPGNHYNVIAGVGQLLNQKQNSWIVSMDISDTFFTTKYSNRNMFKAYLDDRFDFIGGATAGGTSVFINGAIVAYKNSAWGRNFAAEWFKNRCGPMNQLAMWASLFKIWKSEIHYTGKVGWKYDKKQMSSYSFHNAKDANGKKHGARVYARRQAGLLLTDKQQIKAHKEWCETGNLPMALEFPHVLVHGNMAEAHRSGIAYRANMNRDEEPFVCHNTWDRHKESSCNAQLSMCTGPKQCDC